MAEEFPLSLQQLSPVLDVIGHANKHVARVRLGLSSAAAADACLTHTRSCCSFGDVGWWHCADCTCTGPWKAGFKCAASCAQLMERVSLTWLMP